MPPDRKPAAKGDAVQSQLATPPEERSAGLIKERFDFRRQMGENFRATRHISNRRTPVPRLGTAFESARGTGAISPETLLPAGGLARPRWRIPRLAPTHSAAGRIA